MEQLRLRARALRNSPTEAERFLWRQLRFWQLDGHKFRRQQPLGAYIVDFVCLEKRLIIELDGGHHAEQVENDAEREAWLRAQGFTVLRFWNPDVFRNTDGVKQEILKALEESPYLSPPPQGGRKKTKKGKHPVQVRF